MSTKRATLFASLAVLLPAAAFVAAPASAAPTPIHHKAVKHHAVVAMHKKPVHHVVHKVSTHHVIHKKIVHHTAS